MQGFLQEVPGRVAQLVWGRGSGAPDALLDILHEHDMWIPSTFHGCHVGDSVTWLAPGTGSASRIDYIVIPRQCGCGQGGSFVLLDIDFGQKGVDHFGVCVQVQVWLHVMCLEAQQGRSLESMCPGSLE